MWTGRDKGTIEPVQFFDLEETFFSDIHVIHSIKVNESLSLEGVWLKVLTNLAARTTMCKS